jgi:hypothetical protein
MLVFLYSPERPDKNNNKDFYREVKQAALLLSKKHKKVRPRNEKSLLKHSKCTYFNTKLFLKGV